MSAICKRNIFQFFLNEFFHVNTVLKITTETPYGLTIKLRMDYSNFRGFLVFY